MPKGNNDVVYAFSMDYDDCYAPDANHFEIVSGELAPIILKHQKKLDAIKTRINKNKAVVYVGSNRQSIPLDNGNGFSKGTGPCFRQYEAIVAYLGATLNTVLMTDIYHNLEKGETFKQALSLLNEEKKDYDSDAIKIAKPRDWLLDKCKLSILYYQVHDFNCEHLDVAQRRFCFADDNKEILKSLYGFFKKNTQLLPKGLKLELEQYAPNGNEKVLTFKSICGTGPVDFNYKETTLAMVEAALASEEYQNDVTPRIGKIPITTLAQAEKCNFNLEGFDLIQYYRSIQPIATPSQPIATPTQPIATPTQPIATPTQPIATPTQPIATPSLNLPQTLFGQNLSPPKAWVKATIPVNLTAKL